MAPERCTTVEPLLSAWIDGELTAREGASVAAHLPACPRCRATADGLAVTRTLLRAAPVRRAPAEVVQRAATTTGAPRPVRHVRRTAVRAAAGALAASGALGVAGFALGGAPGPDTRVSVPVQVYVGDHLVRTTGSPVSTPVAFEVGR